MIGSMARAPTTADVFNAIAEKKRRDILVALQAHGDDGLSVGQLVAALGLPQPAVSKHLGVLREVGVVAMKRQGRERIYRLDPTELKPVHDWIRLFERYWSDQLQRIKARAEGAAKRNR